MRKRTYITCLVTLILGLLFYGCLDYTPLPMDYEAFKGSPVWELAKAVRSNNLKRIRKLVLEDGVDINFQEERYGYTVLMTALCNSRVKFYRIKPETIELLLQLGADPNIYGDKEKQLGKNPVLVACGQCYYDGLRLLKYGGDPNSQRRKITGRWKSDATALIEAACYLGDDDTKIKCMDLLLKAGADINAKTDMCVGGVLQVSWYEFKVL